MSFSKRSTAFFMICLICCAVGPTSQPNESSTTQRLDDETLLRTTVKYEGKHRAKVYHLEIELMNGERSDVLQIPACDPGSARSANPDVQVLSAVWAKPDLVVVFRQFNVVWARLCSMNADGKYKSTPSQGTFPHLTGGEFGSGLIRVDIVSVRPVATVVAIYTDNKARRFSCAPSDPKWREQTE